MGHSGVEHRLRYDIEERHRLKDEMRKKRSFVAKLDEKIKSTKKRRLNNRYSATIKRYDEEIEVLKGRLKEMNLDLKKRIEDEIKFSEQEVQEFKEQYQQELAEMQETESKLKSIEEEAEVPEAEEIPEGESDEESEEETVSKEAMVARTRRMLNRERRTVDEIQKELSSEERDRVLFGKELQQIIAELEEDGEN